MKYSGNVMLKIITIALIGFALVSCLSLKTRKVKSERIIPLADITASANSWHTDDVSVVYNADKNGNQLVISGKIDLTGKVSGFTTVDSFQLDVYYITDQMQIAERKRLRSAPKGREAETWTFRRELTLPENVNVIAFGYTGTVREGGINSASWDFWHTPY